MPKRSVDLFTPEEHRVISEWLSVEPPADTPNLDEAIAALGFVEGDCQDIITKIWTGRRHRWESLIDVGIVNRYAVDYWADQVWGAPEEEEDDDSIPQGGIEGAILRANPGLTEEDLEEMMKAH